MEGQEVAGTVPAEEEGQHGRRGRGDESWGVGPPEGGPGTRSAAAGAWTEGYRTADRSECSGRAARRRTVEQASVRHQPSGATVGKLKSSPGTGATEAYSDTKGKRRRVQRRKEHRGSQHSSGYVADMEDGRTDGICWRTGGANGGVCSVTRESHYETWGRYTRRVEVSVSTPPGRCYDTLAPGSGQTTRRAAVSASVHTSGVERRHNGGNAGLNSLGGAMPATGRPTIVRRPCHRAHGWPAL